MPSSFAEDANLSPGAIGNSVSLLAATFVPFQPFSTVLAKQVGVKVRMRMVATLSDADTATTVVDLVLARRLRLRWHGPCCHQEHSHVVRPPAPPRSVRGGLPSHLRLFPLDSLPSLLPCPAPGNFCRPVLGCWRVRRLDCRKCLTARRCAFFVALNVTCSTAASTSRALPCTGGNCCSSSVCALLHSARRSADSLDAEGGLSVLVGLVCLFVLPKHGETAWCTSASS